MNLPDVLNEVRSTEIDLGQPDATDQLKQTLTANINKLESVLTDGEMQIYADFNTLNIPASADEEAAAEPQYESEEPWLGGLMLRENGFDSEVVELGERHDLLKFVAERKYAAQEIAAAIGYQSGRDFTRDDVLKIAHIAQTVVDHSGALGLYIE